MESHGGRYTATNVPLILLLQLVYQTVNGPPSGSHIIGAPDWATTERFDIEGKAGGDAGPIPPAQMWLMVQSLLEDRFKLKAHLETRELPVYDLTVARSGLRMMFSADQTPIPPTPDAPLLNPYAAPDRDCGGVQQVGPGERAASPGAARVCRGAINTIDTSSPGGAVTTLSGTAIAMDRLRLLLRSYAGRIVIDKTSLKGLFDFRFQFTDQVLTATPAAASSDPSAPSFFTAVEQELGLKLESTKGPVEVLVIDSVQRPTEN